MSIELHRSSFGREFEAEGACADGAVEIVVARLDLDSQLVRALSAWLSAAELHRARRCYFERDRRRFIVARARLRQLLARCLDTRPATIEFAYGAHGKPRLSDRYAKTGWHFNLSHCDDVAVYAFSLRRRIGIDVEAVRSVQGVDAIAARFFSSRELAAYRALPPRDRLLGFFNCWTRKEACVKALGAGVPNSYDRFDVSLAPDEPARILRGDTRGDDSGWHLESFVPADGFIAALVSERGPTSPERR